MHNQISKILFQKLDPDHYMVESIVLSSFQYIIDAIVELAMVDPFFSPQKTSGIKNLCVSAH